MTTPNLATNPGKIFHHKFSSLSKLVEKASEPSEHVPDMYRASRDSQHDNWSGGSFEQATELATYGWSEGYSKVKELTKQYRNIFDDIFPKQDLQKNVVKDVTGEAVDIGLMLQGIPENMISYQENIVESKIIPGNKLQRIIYQNSFSNNIDKKTIFYYGAMVCCLINAMELHGFRTELVTRSICMDMLNGQTAKEGRQLFIADVTLKHFNDSPDMDKLAFSFSSSVYLRRLIFAVEEQAEDLQTLKDFGVYPSNGYGYPCNYKEDLALATDIYIPYIMSNLDFPTIANNFRQLIEIHFKEEQV